MLNRCGHRLNAGACALPVQKKRQVGSVRRVFRREMKKRRHRMPGCPFAVNFLGQRIPAISAFDQSATQKQVQTAAQNAPIELRKLELELFGAAPSAKKVQDLKN